MYTCTGTCRYEGRVVMGAGFMVVHVYRRKYVGGRGDERKAGGEHVTIELKGEREGSHRSVFPVPVCAGLLPL